METIKMVSKKDKILKEVTSVISQYTQKLTLRQIYYRLVARLVIKNEMSQYKYLSKVLVEGRKNGRIPYNAMEDRTRTVSNNARIAYRSWKVAVADDIEAIRDNYLNGGYHIMKNIYQPKITLIALEKQALEGIFESALGPNSILVVCRGYNSLTQIWDLSKLLKNENRHVHCRFFSDFDPSGLDIQRNFIEQCKDLGIVFDSFKRIGLNKRQINRYELPFAPIKLKDSRAKNWTYPGVVELDALDPNILEKMITDTCAENWDKNIAYWRKRLLNVSIRRYKKHYAHDLIKLAKEIKKNVC